MSECTGELLLDTDMLILLTASGTLEQVVAHLGYTLDQVRRLPAAIHQVRKSARFRDTYGEAVLQRISSTISDIREVSAPTDRDLLDTLNSVMDPGEAQLVAIAATNSCTLLASGDKRAIRDLARSNATDCIKAMQGRIVTLEAVLWILIGHRSPNKIRASFMPVMNHSTLRIVLSEHAVSQRERCLEGIRNYFNDLHKDARGVLYNPDKSGLGAPKT